MTQLIYLARKATQNGVDVLITIHDYQWIITLDHIPPSPEQYAVAKKKPDFLQSVRDLFSIARAVIYPTRVVYEHHAENGLVNDRSFVVPHPDFPMYNARIKVPEIRGDGKINVAFVGDFIPYKGAILYAVTSRNNASSNYHFHVFGDGHGNEKAAERLNLTFHGKYDDKDLYRLLDEHDIHVIVMLSLAMETWCYAMTRVANSGRAIVYLNRGALATRLDPSNPKYIPVEESIDSITEGLGKASDFVKEHAGKENYSLPPGHDRLVTPVWYLENYLGPGPGRV